MPDNANPYIPGQPVDNPDLFFGRRELLVSIGEHLVKGRRVLLVASAPRMGKSSLLRQLPHHLPPELLTVRLDLREENARTLDWLLWRLAGALSAELGGHLARELPAPEWPAFEGRTGQLVGTFWPALREALGERSVVILLDDLHCLADLPDGTLEGLTSILADWRDRDERISFVLTCDLAAQEDLVRSYPHLLAGSVTYTLGVLNSEEASRLITWPVDGVLTYDYGVPRRVIEIASGQPYYLHLVCFEVYNRCAPAGWVNLHDIDLVVADLVGREIADFRQVWDESTPAEQAALAALASLKGARGVATIQEVRTILIKAGARPERGQVAAALDHLALRGIVERLGALTYRFRVALLRDWLAERLDLRQVARSTRWKVVPERPAASRQVSRLAPGGVRQSPAPPREEEPEEQAEAAPVRTRRRNLVWMAPAALGGLVLVVLLGFSLFRGEPGGTATPTSGAARTPMAAITTGTPSLPTGGPTTLPAALPSATAVPGPTNTPTPTPPVVLARPIPAIAYQSRAQGENAWSLVVVDSDGGHRTVVTSGQSGFLAPPAWSPDGSRLVLVSDRSGFSDLWLVDLDGSNAVNLTLDEAKDHSPAWSPDGQWIAFASLRDALYWELYVMRADGSDVRRLTWWEDASDLSPSWSPDGSRIAFASKRDGNWEIYTMDRDGGNLLRLTDHPADDTNPAWSPDGSRIAFESLREGYAEIMIVSVTGGEPVNVSNAPFSSEHGPTWSPDGSRIAFYSDMDGEWDIYAMAADGSNVVKLTGEDTNDQVPAWRP
ncbi:MAG: DPP IV N-terminal domain-containing protein [Anaerolineae bacterium]|jgi:hypothetical protein|nr:DPP IV N-terminal domain-containing protein [Anaerolineae bacterium]